VPRIDENKCTGCRKCISVCPKALITLRPLSKDVQVICRSQDRGAVAKQKCSVACIACTKCVKTCPVQAISMDGQVAVIDSATCTRCGKCVEACPTHAIQQAHAAA
jgi:ferredoxin